MGRLGIISGGGDLPKLIAEDQVGQGEPPFIIDFEGLAVDWADGFDRMTARFEQPEGIFNALRQAGCKEIVMVGAMSRPQLDPSKFDPTFSSIVPKLTEAMASGDDAALRVVLGLFQSAGFDVISPQSVLSTLVLEPGCETIAQPSEYDHADADRAAEILAATSALDIGQGVVVAGRLCLGIETLQGTEALLQFISRTDPALRPERGLLMKAPKSGQDHRLDLPAIGPDTMDQLAAAHLSGVVVPAGSVLVINRPETFARADAKGLFIWSRG